MDKIDWIFHFIGVGKFALIIALALIAHFAVQFSFPKIEKELKKHRKKDKAPIAQALFEALSVPLRVLIWIVAAILIFNSIINHWSQWDIPDPTPKTIRFVIVLALTWFFLRWNRKVHDAIYQRIKRGSTSIRQHQLEAASKLFILFIILVGGITALQVLGINLSALIAIGGFGTLAVGFAGKEVIANFFSGAMLYFTQPFQIGDRVQVPEKNIEGIVENIGWYLTTIRGYDKRPIYVPNSIFSTVQMINGARMTNRRIRTTLTLRYQDLPVVDKVIADLHKMIETREDLDPHTLNIVRLNGYGTYSLDIFFQAFTKTTVWKKFMAIQEEILFECGKIIHKHGADFAFPTTTVNSEKEHPILIDGLTKGK